MMKGIVYYGGRIFQIIGLIALPSAIWMTQIDRSEKGALAIFAASTIVFFAGYLLTRASAKL